MATSTQTRPLVSTEWAQAHLADPGLRFVEVDVDTAEYEKGHLPGAVGFNWQTQLNDRVRRDIPSKEEFEKLLSDAGIDNDTTVVLYGDNNNWFAAFALWLFNYYGHDDVVLIDGGRKKWLAENRPLTTDAPSPARTSYKVAKINSALRATRDLVLDTVRAKSRNLVDVRSAPEFTGEIIAPPGMPETAQRAGHIPGAINVPWAQAVNEDGTFKSADELRALYTGKGVDPSRPTIAYCRIGERSSHTWFVLKHLLELDDVVNYDGSWTEYGNLIGVPIEKNV
ncbi:MAG: sulfurtransferase [Candidatus Eremiobacteraeota bacterium]|nr:sulfurtransferase [Candidatus Eremiobacteraeota bacterium]MBV8366294.1 sulfurtransferase [Candidatus Eremiobacteraeota bacterium]